MDDIERDYKKELRIDKYDLDVEYEYQPKLYADWGEMEAMAKYLMERAEKRLRVVRAEVASRIRKDPKKSGWDGTKAPTEGFITEQVELDKEVEAAEDEYLSLKRDARTLEHALRAFAQRKDAIGNLITLWSKQYYSRPYVQKEVKDDLDKRQRTDLETKSREAQQQHMAGSTSLKKFTKEEEQTHA